MTNTPIIGITTYGPDASALASMSPAQRSQADHFNLPTAYIAAIRRAGGLPWLMPPGETRVGDFLSAIDALILPGGGDVDPGLYGGAAHAAIYGVDRARDDMEIALAVGAIERGLPALAICRGCQVLDVALGGTLIEHLPDVVGTTVAHRGAGPGTRAFHAVEVRDGSKLAEILGDSRPAPSSSHHQAIRTVASRLAVTAHAGDGTIEAVEVADHPFFIGVQWHPEHTAGTDRSQQALFDALVRAAR